MIPLVVRIIVQAVVLHITTRKRTLVIIIGATRSAYIPPTALLTTVQAVILQITTQTLEVVTIIAIWAAYIHRHALLTTVQAVVLLTITTPALANVTLDAKSTAYIHRNALYTTVKAVLLQNTIQTLALVTMFVQIPASMTPIAMHLTVDAVLQAVTTANWITVCLIATQLVEDRLIVLSTTALAV